MIITSTCPLRISLAGGSTDHPAFLEKYGKGKVISFPCNLKAYTTIHQDVFGTNTLKQKYILNYSRREEVNEISQIQNELIRHCFEELNVPQINLTLTSDVYSNGSGLASSSAYIISIIKSIFSLRNLSITESEICKLAMKIERNFNPLVGQQDFFGSMGGLKRISFFFDSDPEIKYLDTSIFKDLDMYLLYTGVHRNSTDILKTLTIENSLPLIDDVEDLEDTIIKKDIDGFHEVINRTWQNKKRTSQNICSNPEIMNIDEMLRDDQTVKSFKLLGAGNGGYFLIFSDKNLKPILDSKYKNITPIFISETGVNSIKI